MDHFIIRQHFVAFSGQRSLHDFRCRVIPGGEEQQSLGRIQGYALRIERLSVEYLPTMQKLTVAHVQVPLVLQVPVIPHPVVLQGSDSWKEGQRVSNLNTQIN